MTIIYCLVALITVFLYFKKKDLAFLLCYIALMTELFLFDTIGSSIRGSDLCFFMNFILLPAAISRRNKEHIKDKNINNIIKLFVGFIGFELAYTVLTGADTFSFAMKVVRIPLLFMAYYPFSTIQLETYKRFLKIMFWITIIQGVLFMLQFVGINMLAGRINDDSFAFAFALNIPTFIYFYTLFSLDAEYTRKHKFLLITFFITILMLTFVRAIIVSILLSVVIYAVMVRGLKRSMTIITALLVITPFAINVMEQKSSVSGSNMSTKEEIEIIISGDINKIRYLAGSRGSSIFRFGMLIERFDYLFENPKYLLFGVGAIHEDSPNCYNRFNFDIGTRNEGRFYGRCLIESGDITWVPITLRYGIVGIAIHLAILITILNMSRERKDNLRILFPLVVFCLITSFNGPLFESPKRCIVLVLYLSLLSRCFTEQKELRL